MDEPNTDPVVNTHRFYCLLLADIVRGRRLAFEDSQSVRNEDELNALMALLERNLKPFIEMGKDCPEPIVELLRPTAHRVHLDLKGNRYFNKNSGKWEDK